jgi:hypothetical protein
MKFGPVIDFHHSADHGNQNATDYRQQAVDYLTLQYHRQYDAQNYEDKADAHTDSIDQR